MIAQRKSTYDGKWEEKLRREVSTDSWTGPGESAYGATSGVGAGRDAVCRDLADFAGRLGLGEVLAAPTGSLSADDASPDETFPADIVSPADGASPEDSGSLTDDASSSNPERHMSAEELRQLFDASGGRVDLARTVVEVLRDQALPQDLSLTSFADYVAALAPPSTLGLSEPDHRVAALLSHLSGFTKRTALQAMASLPAAARDGGIRDGESVLMRLRMAGVVVHAEAHSEVGISEARGAGAGGDRNRLRVPGLLAARLRIDLAARADHEEIIERLVESLVEQLENAQAIDSDLLADALKLSRRSGLWTTLVKLQETFGLSMFLLVPRASCTAFTGLPVEALDAEPDLGFISQVAESLMEDLAEGIDRTAMRGALAALTHPGQMRKHFPGSASAIGGSVPANEVDYFETLRGIVRLAGQGRHAEAAALGLAWSARSKGRRAHLVIRFLTAVSLFHSAQPHRALSILHEIEVPALEDHVDGDFLLPAVFAWSALVGVYTGDHETADDYLARLDEEEWFPVVLDELVRPAMRISAANRALDRLDLDRAREEFDALSAYPENRSLWVFLPVIGRMIAVLSADSESGLLFVNDDVEKHADASTVSATGADLLKGSRSMVFIGLGQLRWAELELEGMPASSDERIVLSARIELVAGHCESAVSLTDTWFYHQALTPVSRAELAAIKAAALLRMGRTAEAVAEFETAVGLCAWVGTLLPLALLPQQDRLELLSLKLGAGMWDELYGAFAGYFRSREEFIDRLRTVGAISVRHASLPQLSTAEAQLLDYLAAGFSGSS